MTVSLDHVGLATTSIDSDVEHYVRTIGLKVIRWGSHSKTGARIAMLSDANGMKLELIEVSQADDSLSHLAFRSPDVDLAHDSAVEAGLTDESCGHWIEAARAHSSTVRMPHSGALIQFIHYQFDSPDLTSPAS